MIKYCKRKGNERLVKILGCIPEKLLHAEVPALRKDKYNKKLEKFYVEVDDEDEDINIEEEREAEIEEMSVRAQNNFLPPGFPPRGTTCPASPRT